jgi:hypothetical protein
MDTTLLKSLAKQGSHFFPNDFIGFRCFPWERHAARFHDVLTTFDDAAPRAPVGAIWAAQFAS